MVDNSFTKDCSPSTPTLAQIDHNFGWASTNQRTSQGRKQSHTEQAEETPRQGEWPMDRRTDRSPMGIQMHPPDNHTRKTIQPNIWHRDNDPSHGGRTHHPKANVQPHPKWGKSSGQPWFGKRTSWQERDPRDRMQTSSVKTLQHQSPTEKFPEGRPRVEDAKRHKKKRREVLIQLGGTFPSPRSRKEGSLSFRMTFGKNCTKDVECHTP